VLKINKILLAMCHLFGFRKDEDHMDDITINIPGENYTEDEEDSIFFKDDIDQYLIDGIKEYLYKFLITYPKMDKKCRNVSQVWITFYRSDDVRIQRSGSVIKMLTYIDGILYYPSSSDIKAFNRIKKINEIIC